jgi:hypothetical protein
VSQDATPMAPLPGPADRSAVAKISSILLAFTGGGRRSLAGIARITGLPLSTTRRLVNALVEAGILDRSSEEDYRPGPRLRLISRLSREPVRPVRYRMRRVAVPVRRRHVWVVCTRRRLA